MKSVYSALVVALLIALCGANLFAQGTIHISLANGGQNDSLSIGVNVNATKGEDRALGENDQPPAPPGGTINFVCSEANNITLRWDLHPGSTTASTKDTFNIKCQLADENASSVTMKWDPAKVRSLIKAGTSALFTSRSGEFTPVNMGVDSQVVYDPSGNANANPGFRILLEWAQLTAAGVVERTDNTPVSFALSQNYPNPFNPTTSIPFGIQKTGFTTVVVYNILGQKIATLVSEELNPGTYTARWNGSDDRGLSVSTGVYYVRMTSNYGNGESFTQMRKMLLMK